MDTGIWASSLSIYWKWAYFWQSFALKNTFTHGILRAGAVMYLWLIERKRRLFVIPFRWSKTNPPILLHRYHGVWMQRRSFDSGRKESMRTLYNEFLLRGCSERKCEMNSRTGSQFQLPWMKAFNPRWIPLIYSSSGRQPRLRLKGESTKCFCTVIQAVRRWASQRHRDAAPKQVSI